MVNQSGQVKMEDKKSFIEQCAESAKDIGQFWQEDSKSFLIHALTSVYKNEVIRDNVVTDIVINGDSVLIKWEKRFPSLTDEQLKERYS